MASITVKVKTAQLAKPIPSKAPPTGAFGAGDPDPPPLRDWGLGLVTV
jgi:hypothetical protein